MDISIIVDKLTTKYPDLLLKADTTYYWSPNTRTVHYKSPDSSESGAWSLLHESGHALLGHTNYYSDFELVKLEAEAWKKAQSIEQDFGLTIDEDHIQDCLDSYRGWLHKRSLCPDCRLSGIQTNASSYTCIFCHKCWEVSSDRFCRPYRKRR